MATLVQHRATTIAGGATSVSLAFSSPATVGNRSLAGMMIWSGTASNFVSSVTDNGSTPNSYNADLNFVDTTTLGADLDHHSGQIASNPGSGNLQVTWNFTGSVNIGGGSVEIEEVSGLGTAANIVSTSGTNNPGTNVTTASVTTSANPLASEYCFGVLGLSGSTAGMAGASGTTLDDVESTGGAGFFHKAAAGGATETLNGSWTSAAIWVFTVVAYKLAAGVSDPFPAAYLKRDQQNTLIRM